MTEFDRDREHTDEEETWRPARQSELDGASTNWELQPETAKAIYGPTGASRHNTEKTTLPTTEQQERHKSPESLPEKQPGGPSRPSWSSPPDQNAERATDTPELNRTREGLEQPDWRLQENTKAALYGQEREQGTKEGEHLDHRDLVDADCFTDLPAKQATNRREFREEMARKSPHERGAWGERATIEEARARGHRVLTEHGDTPTTPGYDCVSWDASSNTLHVWEAKNYSCGEAEKAGIAASAGAWEQERALPNTAQFLNDVPLDDPDRSAIAEAVQRNQVEWHLRLGPDTDFSFAPRPPGGGLHDVRRHAYGYMIRFSDV